jgi:hypothetical protein
MSYCADEYTYCVDVNSYCGSVMPYCADVKSYYGSANRYCADAEAQRRMTFTTPLFGHPSKTGGE